MVIGPVVALPTRQEIILTTAITKNIVGAGMFALSAALSTSRTGLIPGLVLVALLAALSGTSFCLLAKFTASSSHDGCSTTEDLWRHTVGPGAAWIAAITLVQACGTLVQYSATLAELLGPAAEALSRRQRLLAVGLVLLPLCLTEDLEGLRHSSSIGLAGVMYSVLFVCWRAVDGSYAPGGRFVGARPIAAAVSDAIATPSPVSPWSFGWRSLSLVGVLNTAYFAHLNVPAYWHSWATMHAETHGAAEARQLRSGFIRVVAVAFGLVALLYAGKTFHPFAAFAMPHPGLTYRTYRTSSPNLQYLTYLRPSLVHCRAQRCSSAPFARLARIPLGVASCCCCATQPLIREPR